MREYYSTANKVAIKVSKLYSLCCEILPFPDDAVDRGKFALKFFRKQRKASLEFILQSSIILAQLHAIINKTLELCFSEVGYVNT